MSDRLPPDAGRGKPGEDVVWLPFAGTAEKRGPVFRLVARCGNGFLELGDNDVGFAPDGQVFVRKGAVVSHVDEPWRTDAGAHQSPAGPGDDCPGGITCCVGSVQVCCQDFRVIGSGVGAWGCARVFQP